MAHLKQFVLPKYLYRYRQFNNKRDFLREVAAIRGDYIFAASFDKLNDPTEGIFRSISKSRSVKDALDGMLFNQGMGICSFSETHNHHLMWAHYAQQFSGICVRYNVEKLLSGLSDDLFLTRVHYDDFSLKIDLNNDLSARYKSLSRKNSAWSYEREWRILSNESGKKYYKNNIKIVDRIFLGIRFHIEYESIIENLCLEKSIKLKDMRITDSKYLINFSDYENGGAL